MLQTVNIPFPEYRPDDPRPQTRMGAMSGLIPDVNGYHNGINLNLSNETWGETSAGVGQTDLYLGGFTALSDTGTSVTFVGNTANLYQRASGWGDTLVTELTRGAGGDYATPKGNLWQFAQFGNYVIAVNGDDKPQYFLFGTSTLFDDLDDLGSFAGTLPRAKYVIAVGEFVVFGYENKVAWSGLNNIAQWTPGEEGSDVQELPDSGNVTGLIPYQNGFIVATERNLQYFNFIGGSYTFSRQVVNERVGCAGPYSMVRAEDDFYFLSRNGFRKGVAASPIGRGRVDTAYLRKLLDASISSTTQWMQTNFIQLTDNPFQVVSNPTAYDYVTGYWADDLGLIIWGADGRFISGQTNAEAAKDVSLAYSPALDRWVDSPVGLVRAGWQSVRAEADEYPVGNYIYLDDGNTTSYVTAFNGCNPWSFTIQWWPGNENVYLQKIRLIGTYGGNVKLVSVKAYDNRYDGEAAPHTTFTPSALSDEADENTNSWHWVGVRGRWFEITFQQEDNPTAFTEQLVGLEAVIKTAGRR